MREKSMGRVSENEQGTQHALERKLKGPIFQRMIYEVLMHGVPWTAPISMPTLHGGLRVHTLSKPGPVSVSILSTPIASAEKSYPSHITQLCHASGYKGVRIGWGLLLLADS